MSRITRALVALFGRAPAGLSPVDDNRGWHTLWTHGGGETFSGSWQQDVHPPFDRSLAFFAVYACVTQIAGDIAKLCLRLMEKQDSGIWLEGENSAYSPFLRRPNHFQTMQQFVETWQICLSTHGNVYSLKERDNRGVVVREYILDPDRVTPLVAPDGSVFYELQMDDLSHLPMGKVAVPASEIIHDRINCLFHPLVGVSPLYACGLAASQGLAIQRNSAFFFKNLSRPGGILTAPTKINDETAARLKREFEENYKGTLGLGKTLVAGDGLKYEPMAVTPKDATLVEQLQLSAEQVCAAFGVPKFMIGIGEFPGTDNVQALTQWYYTACLQKRIEAFERLQDDGLSMEPKRWRTEFDLDDLLRMDSKTLAETEGVLVQRGISSPDESRRKFNKPPVEGGKSPYLQQQNFSLAALAKRDASADPFATAKPPAPPPPADDEARATAQALREAEAALARANEALAERDRKAAELEKAIQFRDHLKRKLAQAA